MRDNPVSPKMLASTGGAGVGAALSSLIVWLLGISIWGQPATADGVNAAMAAVPTPVSAIVLLGVTGALAAVFGYSVADPLRLTQSQWLDYQQMSRARALDDAPDDGK